MEVNEQSLASLRELLTGIMCPDNTTRKNAESYFDNVSATAGFTTLVLAFVSGLGSASTPEDIALRQVASVMFKNIVKKRWVPEEDSDDAPLIDADKEIIKTHIVELMCSASVDVQKQLAEAVTLISKHDFPGNWGNLLPHLVSKLASGSEDIQMSKGVMLTANSIMKRFRYAFKSDELFSEILIALKDFQEPLTQKFIQNGALIEKYANSKAELTVLFETQRLMTRIFFSLNWQDIPEYFEDNVKVWMEAFAKHLVYAAYPVLVDGDEENEPGPIEKLQAAILENLNLYATKYEDILAEFLPQFTQVVWTLLVNISAQPKYDLLATSAIKFLTSVSSKQMNVALFDKSTLQSIVSNIVVKNLTATEADEELFEDNPIDYIRKDMEGSDQDTRRRSATELVRALLNFFGPEVSQMCVTYIGAMLEQYATTKDWKMKDAALHLVLAISIMSSSSVSGAGELNPHVQIMELFNSQVLPEVHDMDVNARHIVKADAIKMICIFRSHLQVADIISLLPHIIRHLNSSHVVIQTYAAMCVERFLVIKDRDSTTGTTTMRITKEMLQPFFQPLFEGLFTVLGNQDLPENDYVMKCVMRVLVVAGSDVAPITELIISHLTTALNRVCSNATNPHYNHYLFECLAVLIKSTTGPNGALPQQSCDRFEELLFPPFNEVLAKNVEEFVPYVFQILAQLLASRPTSGLSEPYKQLFPPTLSPALWELKGNVPALTQLFKAYISKGMNEIIAGNYLQGVLGVFQKLLSARSSEAHAFAILDALFSFNALDVLTPYIGPLFELLLRRMKESISDSKKVKYARLFLHSMCLFSARFSGQTLYDTLDSKTPGLLGNIVISIWGENKDECGKFDFLLVKHMVVGGMKLLLESPVSQSPDVFVPLLKAMVALVNPSASSSAAAKATANIQEMLAQQEEDEGVNKDFDSTYSKLTYAYVPTQDPVEVQYPAPASTHFITTLANFCATRPGQYLSVIQNGLDSTEAAVLTELLRKNGLQLS